ncbi:hypothetical protein [Saccharibacillus kuerlensis]|uniref:Uncharacterized protein n=1 Tax=Saccharibacillus kuerlensis TaxID=459527 RepID=A0ABQ2L1G8_9BACL|nr:hypothetical protein GCM10010969_19420 [Saccharibacillus kuerlensis]
MTKLRITGDYNMAYRPTVVGVDKAGSNEKDGLYEYVLHLEDGTMCRTFYNRFPEGWRMTHVSRLLKTPCPICRKDYICNCFEKFKGELDAQMKDGRVEELLA